MTVRHAAMVSIRIGVCVLGCAFAVCAVGQGNDEPRPARRGDIRVDSNLVLIPVSVTDARNHPVVGIDAHQFRVFDGKVEQEVVSVSTDDSPVSVGIVFDASGSMAHKLPQARAAVIEFLKGANPDDEFFLVNFSTTAEVAVPFTTSAPEIQNRLMYAVDKGKTALLDAVHLAMETMKDARNPRKALLIISDGGDNESRFTRMEIRKQLRETDIWIYAIGVYGTQAVTLPEEERGGPMLLQELAEQTGGRHFAVFQPKELPDAAAKIGMDLRNQYLVGYRPSNIESDGKFHKVQVKLVDSGNVQLTWRSGYYAPLERPHTGL
jgi:VWFA-related protein